MEEISGSEILDQRAELNQRLSLVLDNKKAIEDKLNGNGISPFKRKCLEYQRDCLLKPIDRITAQLMEMA